jgi:hypothetical protein
MINMILNRSKKIFLVAMVILLGTAGLSSAAVFNLKTGSITKTMPDGAMIPMWGFGLQTGNVTVPGPELVVPPGDTTLTINLQNNLTVPVSIIIPGLTPAPGDITPVRNQDGRVRSFVKETSPGGTSTYTFTVKPGTYLYQSGSHQQIQVPMGLYGAVKNDAGVGLAYPGVNYSQDKVILFSEIDPVINNAVATGNYGPGLAVTSIVDYTARYFLINGNPFSVGVPPLLTGSIGQNILLRFLNAGLKDYVPILQGSYMTLWAEDGNQLPFPKRQYSVLLPAGKTMDAMVTSFIRGKLPLYDRRLSLTNNLASPGGIFNYLIINGEPIADFSGDGKTDIAVYRASTGAWYINPSSGAAPYGVGWGGDATDIPAPGDYDGDGKTDVAVYRVSNGGWYVIPSSGAAPYGVGWGGDATDKPVPGDYDGDGKTDIAVYRTSTGVWYVFPSGGAAPYGVIWGVASDKPVPGDYDGDGKTDIAFYRPSTGVWNIIPSSTGTPYPVSWGGSLSDVPLTTIWALY